MALGLNVLRRTWFLTRAIAVLLGLFRSLTVCSDIVLAAVLALMGFPLATFLDNVARVFLVMAGSALISGLVRGDLRSRLEHFL